MIIVIISGPGAGYTITRELIEEEIRRRENLPKLSDIKFISEEKHPISEIFNEDFLKLTNIHDPFLFKPKKEVNKSVLKNKFPKLEKIKPYKYIPNKRKGHQH